ncbi:tol-pal system YbgF family protein [Candidatus Latescibacterota bacterium]
MRKIFTLIVLIITFSGCAYFNTFYLAKKNFNEAEKKRLDNKGVVIGSTKTQYNAAIKWASGILENHMDSKYVDDSLYIIGMSYFYQQDFLKARTKFDELLGAFPESELALTAQYFKAKSLIELDFTDEAVLILLELINSDNPSVSGLAGLTIAEISLENEDWEELLNASQKVIDLAPNDDEKVTAIYYKSKALYELGRYEDCTAELIELANSKIDSELKFNINTLLALSEAQLEKFDVAMSYLESMQNRGEFSDYAPRIRLQIGNIYEFQNDDEMAMDTYRKLAGDFPDSLAAKEAWYNVGKILIRDLSNAEEAKNAFDMVKKGSARTNASWFVEAGIKSVQIDSMMARIEKIEDIEEKFEDFKRNSNTSQLGTSDTEQETATENAFADSAETRTDLEGISDSSNDMAFNYAESIGRVRFSLAELYNYSFERPDSALVQYRLIISEATGTEYEVKSDYFLQIYELRESGKYSDEADNDLMMKMIEKYPDSGFTQELKVILGLIEKPPEVKAYMEAEHAYTSGESPDTYLPLYQAVIDKYPNTKSTYQARFFIAYAYEHYVGDMETALQMYEALSEEAVNINSETYINLAIEKLRMLEQKEDLLREVNESIAYYNMRIEELEKGTRLEEPTGSGVTASDAGVSQTNGNGYTGMNKIRARNARIRSRYYKN